jgi:ribosomal protein S18 acetylase RimI-like enzyme
MLKSLSLRPLDLEELDWLFELHEATYRQLAEAVWGPWDSNWQRSSHAALVEENEIQVVEWDGLRVGALYTHRNEDHSLEVELLEIQPSSQGRGAATAVMDELARMADHDAYEIALRVLKVNDGAQRLYERLGYILKSETETHWLMRRLSPTTT